MSEQTNQPNIERVRKGDDIWVQVEGGCARKRAERDGFKIEADPIDVYVSDADVDRMVAMKAGDK